MERSQEEEKDGVSHKRRDYSVPNIFGNWRAFFCAECTKGQKEDGVVVVKEGGQLAVTVCITLLCACLCVCTYVCMRA